MTTPDPIEQGSYPPVPPPYVAAADSAYGAPGDVSPKLLLPAVLLCFFLGSLGIHRFYVGKVGTGIAMILTLGGLGIWTLIDFIMLLVGVFKDKEGRVLKQWT
ncbi:TM2 domain-containing protein [Cellulomonas sp. HZM]|uniref:TM2 domain-containing protein n=1 Tax=Cellulomonas sp. HZM TaxID=1454010 RepID=UPI0009DFA48B|nr:TM2 domain-containing protein [Cellulomonas sp. HZM]